MTIDIEIVGNWDWRCDAREPYGVCRWCGEGNDEHRQGLALIRQDGAEWYECPFCAVAIIELDLDISDADAIRRESALLRAGDDADPERKGEP